MAKAGQIAASALRQIAKNVRPGVKVNDLDKIADEKIKSFGAESSFKKVNGYQYTICTTPNDWVVHGIPENYVLKEGDILGVDLGAYFEGFHSDLAYTFPVGKVSDERRKFLATGEKALQAAVKKVKIGGRIGDISETIQHTVERAGYSVVKELVGHGVGRNLHEDPLVPGIGKKDTGEKIEEGIVLAVEVIYNQGKPQVQLLPDGWSIATKDGLLAGLFETTVAATKKKPLVLTKYVA